MKTLIYLVLALVVLGSDASAQKKKPTQEKGKGELRTKIVKPLPTQLVVEEDLPTISTKINRGGIATAWVSVPVVQTPEPLIGINYLITYPKEAQQANIKGIVRFTVRVKEGKVVHSQIDVPDHALLNDAVLEAANRLQFDLSWHTPDKPEFLYTKEVRFALPDSVILIPSPPVYESGDEILRMP